MSGIFGENTRNLLVELRSKRFYSIFCSIFYSFCSFKPCARIFDSFKKAPNFYFCPCIWSFKCILSTRFCFFIEIFFPFSFIREIQLTVLKASKSTRHLLISFFLRTLAENCQLWYRCKTLDVLSLFQSTRLLVMNTCFLAYLFILKLLFWLISLRVQLCTLSLSATLLALL